MRIVTLFKGGPAAALPLLVAALLVPASPSLAYIYAGTTQLENWMTAPQTLVQQIQASRFNKFLNYLDERYRVPRGKAQTIVGHAMEQGAQWQLAPELILAVIAVESTFNERAVSPVGARGLMQIMARYHPEKVQEIGGAQALFEPEPNIGVGARILAQYRELSAGNIRHALLRYNGSLGNPRSPYADKVLKVYEDIKAFNPLPDPVVAQVD